MRYKIWSAHFYRAESLLKKYGEDLAPFSPQIHDAKEDGLKVTIELNSLEDLRALIKAVAHEIVMYPDNEITIYDDWLE
jgi:hypothetical protein